MASEDASPDETPPRPLVVDLLRAYEGLLVGVLVIIVALVASAGTPGPAEFVALLVVPPIVMVWVMHRGAAPRLFRVRAAGAVLGWAAAWALFPLLALTSYYLGDPMGGDYAVFTILAILDGVVLGLVLAAVDRIAARMRMRRSASEG